MSKIRLLKGYLENSNIQKVLTSKGLKMAVCAVAISAMSIAFVGSRLAGDAKASESDKKTYPPTQFVEREKDKVVVDLSNYNPQPITNKGKGNLVNGGVIDIEKPTLPDTGKEEDDIFVPVIPVPDPEKPVVPEEPVKPEDGYYDNGYVEDITEEYKAVTVKRFENLAIADNFKLETEVAETPDMLVELGRIRIPAHEINGSKFEWDALKALIPEQISDIIISIEEPVARSLSAEDAKHIDVVVKCHEVRYDLNGDGYEDNKYLKPGTDLGAHFEKTMQLITEAMVSKGYKEGDIGEYYEVIRVPMHEYNGKKALELDTIEDILSKYSVSDFKIDVHRKGDSGAGNMWIIVYFTPDKTDADNDGYIDNMYYDEHTESKMASVTTTYRNVIANSGTAVKDSIKDSEVLASVNFPLHYSNGKLDSEKEKLAEIVKSLGVTEVEVVVTQTPAKDGVRGVVTVDIKGVKPVIPEEPTNEAPVITGKDVTVEFGAEFSLDMLGISVSDKEDGEIAYELVSNDVNTSKPGKYTVKVKATDKQGLTTFKEFIVTVNEKPAIPPTVINNVPVINGRSIEINQFTTFSIADLGITVSDKEDGALEFSVVSNNVNTEIAGDYSVTVEATDSQGATVSKTFTVKVIEVDTSIPSTGMNAAPVVTGSDVTLEVGNAFDLAMLNIVATDAEDGSIGYEVLSNNVDMAVAGVYNVVVKATDSKGASFTLTLTVTVNEKPSIPAEPINVVPVITGNNITLKAGESFDASMLGISVSDAEDGTLEYTVVNSTVDMSTPGVYEVTVSATDSQGATVTATYTVTVEQVELTDAQFMQAVEQAILRMVNEERANAGLGAYSWSDESYSFSVQKSQDMLLNGYFDHADLNGKFTYQYMQEAGLTFGAWGENIGRYRKTTTDPEVIATAIMQLWMNSDGHRANILSSKYENISIGVYKQGNMYYATQIFLKK